MLKKPLHLTYKKNPHL